MFAAVTLDNLRVPHSGNYQILSISLKCKTKNEKDILEGMANQNNMNIEHKNNNTLGLFPTFYGSNDCHIKVI